MKQIDTADQVNYLFDNTATLRLIRFFLVNDDESYKRKELADKVDQKSKDVGSALKQLEKAGLIKAYKRKQYYYRLDTKSELIDPLRQLLKFDYHANVKALRKLFKETGKLKYLIFTGNLTGNKRSDVDVLVVADKFDEAKFEKLLQEISYKVGYELRYVAFNTEDFEYRSEMNDRLIRNIVDFDHDKIIG